MQSLLGGRVHREVLSVASPPAQVLQQQIRTESDGQRQYQEVSQRREHEEYAEKSHASQRVRYYPQHSATALLYQPYSSLAYETRMSTVYVVMNNTRYGNHLAGFFIAVT